MPVDSVELTDEERPAETHRPSARPNLGVRLRSYLVRTYLTLGVLPFVMVGLVLLFAVIEPRFIGSANLFNLGRQATFLVIVAMGQGLVLLSGGFDLSVGGTIALTSVVAASVMTASTVAAMSPVAAILIAVAAGLLISLLVGVINGVTVAILRVSPFVVTLAMASVTGGAALMLADGAPVRGLPEEYTFLGTGRLLGLPVSAVVALAVVIAILLLVGRTRFGRYVYAIGGNINAARLSGIRVRANTIVVYVTCSLLAGVAGVLLTARVSSGEPNLGGEFPLESIAAGVLGGIALGGGEGRMVGALGGAIFVVMMKNGMNLIRVSSYVQLIVLGVALILAVVIDRMRDRVRARYA